MLKPREELILDAVAEVLRTGLAEARRETDARFAQIAPPPDLTPLEAKVAAVETRTDPEIVRHYLEEKLDLKIDALETRLEALPPPPDLAPLTEKIAALEARPEPKDGLPGKDAEPVDVEAIVAQVVAQVPVPKDGLRGPPGLPGKDAPPVDFGPLVDTVLAQIAIPKDGKDGVNGKDGTSVTVDQVRDLLDTAFAKWALDVERRIMDMAQKAIDRMPQPKDGVDGLSFDDIEFESIDHRTLECRGIRDGVVVKTHVHHFATPFDRGVWKAGVEYHIGDGVTWDGSWWIAKKDKPEGKPGTDDGFRLAVKKGRDGKNGVSIKGEKGDPGPRGQNLTALMPNGDRFP